MIGVLPIIPLSVLPAGLLSINVRRNNRLGTAEVIPEESEQVAPHEPLEVLQLLDVVLEDVGADDIQVV